ncbi:MAG TPA: hypothetical protein DDW58_03320, partial [Clostridiaceae bacterium]|nr:hypothetical protein [Clostridiaceae bacterium]
RSVNMKKSIRIFLSVFFVALFTYSLYCKDYISFVWTGSCSLFIISNYIMLDGKYKASIYEFLLILIISFIILLQKININMLITSKGVSYVLVLAYMILVLYKFFRFRRKDYEKNK